MSLIERLTRTIAEAMKARDQARLSPLRMLKAALMNREVERGGTLTDADELQVVATMVKQRKESIDQFAKGGRPDLVEKETAELAILETYLPPALAAEDLERIVSEVVEETGATSPKDVGRVMKAVMTRLAGARVDGRAVNELVRTKLAR
ncbi:MAG TPA: GatB/YqeY domain-containing protein [Vicinamibacterales bacterium]